MYKLKEVIISITNRCNSSCKICDIPKAKKEELSTSHWKSAIRESSLLGASTVVFSGGEPLMREDIFELISFTKMNGMNACIASNGLMINEEIAFKLSNSGIDVVNISVEGPKVIHDYLRGRDSFEKAISALNNLKKCNIESTIATMVSRYNYEYLPCVVNLAKESSATTVKFQPFNTIFIGDKSRESEFLISKREAMELKQIFKKVMSLCGRYGISTNPGSYLEKIPLYLSGNLFNNRACRSLWTSCPITSEGKIYPCWILNGKDKLIGNIKEKKFGELWNSKNHNLIREKIIKKGCTGCLMSCYDEAFGMDSIGKRMVLNLKRLKSKGLYKYLHWFLKGWLKRLKFYYSYRGSLKEIIKRLKVSFKNKKLFKRQLSIKVNKEKIEEKLSEIETVKEMIRKEIKLLK